MDTKITFRLPEKDYIKFESLCRLTNLNKSEFLRNAVLNEMKRVLWELDLTKPD